MSKMTFLERRYRRRHLSCVRHTTLDPKGPGVVRMHLIPPRSEEAEMPFLLLLNGAKLIPLNLSWAILLANFMDQLEPYAGREIGQEDWQTLMDRAVSVTRRTYPGVGRTALRDDLNLMLNSLVSIARGG